MLKNRLGAARAVAGSLLDSENRIDAALLAAARLSTAMLEGRASANLSALYGQDALDAVARAQLALAEARRHVVEAHRKLAVVKHDIGLDHVAIGDGAPKPPVPGFFTEGQDNSRQAA